VADPQAELPRTPESPGGVQVIARVGQILRALSGEAQGLSLAQLAQRIGLPRSTVHRIVTALTAEGLVATASPAGRVRIGPEFARLASYSQADLWKKDAEPYMRRIFAEIGETVDLSVLDGDHVRVIYGIPARHHLHVTVDIGSTFPLYGSSKGRAILAAYPPDVAARMLPDRLEPLTEKTVITREGILALLDKVRQTGIAYNLEEATAGICTQAIAIRGATGALLAISVPVPAQRYWAIEDKITRVLLEVRKEAIAALDPPGTDR
jgi:DNA-binding IclR family transcriptional regulator